MRKILTVFFLFIFVFYWALTFLFTLPENYITISLSNESQLFHTFFFQRWGFFAPPPNYNERLYYTFINPKEKSKNVTYEVLQPLNSQNSKDKIFNYQTDILDYVLSNSISNITETIRDINKVYAFKDKETKKSFPDSTQTQVLSSVVFSSPQFVTIKNYAKLVALKNGVSAKNSRLVITLTIIPLPKFYQRLDKIVNKEEVIFKSSEIPM